METFLNIIPIIVPTIVAVGVMVFVSYRNKNAADNHQVRISPVLCIIFNVVLIIGVAFFIFIMFMVFLCPIHTLVTIPPYTENTLSERIAGLCFK